MNGNDFAEIVNLLNVYAIAVDGLQWDVLDKVFTPDVKLQYPSGAAWTDLATFKKDFHAAHAPMITTQHVITNHQVVFNGDHANALSYARARIIRAMPRGEGQWWEVGAWYDDVLVRTPAGWRISSRVCRANWWDGNIQVANPAMKMIFFKEAAASGDFAYIKALNGK
jgi:hypothetical protein